MEPSKYLKAFQNVALDIPGDGLLVEVIDPPEMKTKSGLILAESKSHMNNISADLPTFVHVLAVGKGYFKEGQDGEPDEDVPLSSTAGDVILVGINSVRKFGFLPIEGYKPYSIGLIRDGEAQLRFKGIEDYRKTFQAINGAIEAKVEK